MAYKITGMRPSMRGGIIGRDGLGSGTAGDVVASYYTEDDGRAKYYVNPHGFTGLNGFEVDTPGWGKRAFWRQPRASSAGIMARKREPFR